MPILSEPAVVVTGRIVDIQQNIDFATQRPDGVVVLLSSPSGGYCSTKVKGKDVDSVRPVIGQFVAWRVMYGAQDNGRVWAAFRGLADTSDLAALEEALNGSKAKSA